MRAIAFHVHRLILSPSCDFHLDLKYRLFGVVLMVLILCAGLVGGVAGILLPKICLGVSLGFSFALLLSTVRHRFLPSNDFSFIALIACVLLRC